MLVTVSDLVWSATRRVRRDGLPPPFIQSIARNGTISKLPANNVAVEGSQARRDNAPPSAVDSSRILDKPTVGRLLAGGWPRRRPYRNGHGGRDCHRSFWGMEAWRLTLLSGDVPLTEVGICGVIFVCHPPSQGRPVQSRGSIPTRGISSPGGPLGGLTLRSLEGWASSVYVFSSTLPFFSFSYLSTLDCGEGGRRRSYLMHPVYSTESFGQPEASIRPMMHSWLDSLIRK